MISPFDFHRINSEICELEPCEWKCVVENLDYSHGKIAFYPWFRDQLSEETRKLVWEKDIYTAKH